MFNSQTMVVQKKRHPVCLQHIKNEICFSNTTNKK